MNAEQYETYSSELCGFNINVTTYKIDTQFYCIVDNVDPGAQVAKAKAPTKDAAIEKALKDSEEKLSNTRRNPV